MTIEVTRVPFVYGGHCYVATADLENTSKIMLPLYMRDGRKWGDTITGERAVKKGAASHLHRENIGVITS